LFYAIFTLQTSKLFLPGPGRVIIIFQHFSLAWGRRRGSHELGNEGAEDSFRIKITQNSLFLETTIYFFGRNQNATDRLLLLLSSPPLGSIEELQ
jgi:hypothetical protein